MFPYFTAAPVKPALETDLKTLADAANEAAKREAAQWFYFVTIMLTLAALVGSTTHRVLFLEDPVRVPFLGVELPLLGFYVVAPAIFLVLHFYLLAQLRLMAAKLRAFLDELDRQVGEDAAARERALQRLDSFSVLQLLVSEHYGTRHAAVRLMAWTTLVVAPVLLLLFFQLRFLPYQAEWITWWHRVLILVDLALVWWLWPSFAGPATRRFWHRPVIGWSGAALVLVFAVLVATVPDEAAELDGPVGPVRAWLFDRLPQPARDAAGSPFARRIILIDEDLVPEDDRVRSEALRTRSLRGRDLRGAVLQGSDLRKADFTAADLQGARLDRALLQGALFEDAKMAGASLVRAQLQGANLTGAQLQGAHLDGAQLQGAQLRSARLTSAFLVGAGLQGASLTQTDLRAAVLYGASLQGAALSGTQLQGSILVGARMQAAAFQVWDEGPLARFADARLDRANLHSAALWRSVPSRAKAGGAVLTDASFAPTPPQDPALPARNEWQHWVEAWTQAVPQGDRRASAENRLRRLLRPPLPDNDAAVERAWAERVAEDPGPDWGFPELRDAACEPLGGPAVIGALLRQPGFRVFPLAAMQTLQARSVELRNFLASLEVPGGTPPAPCAALEVLSPQQRAELRRGR